MENEIKKIVARQFPELASGYHLPILARVESISDPNTQHNISDPFRNRFSVDVRLLDAQGTVDDEIPLICDVPLPVPNGGIERGTFAYPGPGTVVEVAFAYGLPDQIFIRTILGRGLGLPPVVPGDHLNQTAPGVFDRTSASGDKERVTHGSINDTCSDHALDALSSTISVIEHTLKAEGNSTEFVTGMKTVEALGALKLLSGGHCNIAAANNLNVTTASDHNVTAGHDINTRAANVIDSLAKLKQLHKVEDGGKIWLGNESNNILALLSELMGIVISLADTLATHTHLGVKTGIGNSGPPVQSASFTQTSSNTSETKSKLDPIVE